LNVAALSGGIQLCYVVSMNTDALLFGCVPLMAHIHA
jgi:hypothetical protein